MERGGLEKAKAWKEAKDGVGRNGEGERLGE